MVADKKNAIEKLSLYFFLAIADEDKVEKAIHKVWRELSAKTLNWKTRAKSWEKLLIVEADKVHTQINSGHGLHKQGTLQRAFKNTAKIEWAGWQEFACKSSKQEVAAVLWVKVLGFPEDLVAESLEISEGTLRYRLNRGLLKLGEDIRVGADA